MFGAIITQESFLKNNQRGEYPRLVLIQLPQGYEPCALPMRYAGKVLPCLESAGEDEPLLQSD